MSPDYGVGQGQASKSAAEQREGVADPGCVQQRGTAR